MRQFKRERFTYGGRRGEDFGLYICEVGSGSSGRQFGVNKTIKEEKTNNFIPSFQGIDYDSPTIPITLCKLDSNGRLKSFRDDENFEIIKWLFQSDGYLPFISHDNKDVLYYAQFIKGQDFSLNAKNGYLTLDMKLNCATAFSTIAHHNYTVMGSKDIEIYCKQNIERYASPDIEFQLIGDETNFTLMNLTLGESMEFKDLKKGSHIMCYNDGLKQIIVVNNPNENVRKNFNKKWTRLIQGRNVLRVVSNCKVDIILQTKIALQ